MPVKLKRIYEKPTSQDGFRVLVDRLWPRGLDKDKAAVDLWMKELSPSTELRKWFNHDPKKWAEFRKRYFEELKGQDRVVQELVQKCRGGTVTLLFAAKDQAHNNAVALSALLKKHT